MNIYPAIDLMDGKVVRLTKGEFESKEILFENPCDALEDFIKKGAKCLHVVDLDGAKDGSLSNFNTIKKLREYSDIFIQVGGGIRDEERIKKYLDSGVNRVILGTIAIENFNFVKEMVEKYGDKIAVGVDAKNGFVATHGWLNVSEIESFDFCQKCFDVGVSTIIYTDIETDGAMKGTNLKAFEKLAKIKGLNIIASGGISFYWEIEELCKIETYGAILGKAIYKNLIDLEKVINMVKCK